jgi:hypothetical protein
MDNLYDKAVAAVSSLIERTHDHFMHNPDTGAKTQVAAKPQPSMLGSGMAQKAAQALKDAPQSAMDAADSQS